MHINTLPPESIIYATNRIYTKLFLYMLDNVKKWSVMHINRLIPRKVINMGQIENMLNYFGIFIVI